MGAWSQFHLIPEELVLEVFDCVSTEKGILFRSFFSLGEAWAYCCGWNAQEPSHSDCLRVVRRAFAPKGKVVTKPTAKLKGKRNGKA